MYKFYIYIGSVNNHYSIAYRPMESLKNEKPLSLKFPGPDRVKIK